jgi:hypothetical protein
VVDISWQGSRGGANVNDRKKMSSSLLNLVLCTAVQCTVYRLMAGSSKVFLEGSGVLNR